MQHNEASGLFVSLTHVERESFNEPRERRQKVARGKPAGRRPWSDRATPTKPCKGGRNSRVPKGRQHFLSSVPVAAHSAYGFALASGLPSVAPSELFLCLLYPCIDSSAVAPAAVYLLRVREVRQKVGSYITHDDMLWAFLPWVHSATMTRRTNFTC